MFFTPRVDVRAGTASRPLLVPFLSAAQGGHFEAARKELMKMLKVGSKTMGHTSGETCISKPMIHGSYDA